MDGETEPRRSLISYFDLNPNQFAWRGPRVDQIERRRARLGDLLIFDILLTSGGIREPDTLYPPVDGTALQRLLDAIEKSTYDALKKECLVYFLLKWHQDGREERYRDERCIPPQFAALSDAYWCLDAAINIPRAVSILSDCRLNADYSSKILQAISLSPNATPLVLRYIRTAKPPLIEPDDINIYTLALAETNFVEAWQFQRTFNEKDETRSRLFKTILEWTVMPSARSQPLTQLLALPLSTFEESLLHQFTLQPPETISRSSLAILQDLVCVRLIQAGRTIDALKIDRQYLANTNKNTNSEPRSQERTAMVQELLATLPRPERILLDAELELIAEGGAIVKHSRASPLPQEDAEAEEGMQSWEDIRLPPSLSQSLVVERPSQSISAPIPERSGAPRFGGHISASAVKDVRTPIIPLPKSMGVPRKSFPLPSAPDSFSMVQPRKSLGTDFQLRPTSTNITPKSANAPKLSHVFESATQKPNAFYTPKKANGAGSISTRTVDTGANVESDVEPEEVMGAQGPDVSMDDDALFHRYHAEPETPHHGETASHLGFSVFGVSTPRPNEGRGGKEPQTPKISSATTATLHDQPVISAVSTSSKGGKPPPPGALYMYDVGDEFAEEPEEPQWQQSSISTAPHSISASREKPRTKSLEPGNFISSGSKPASSRTKSAIERSDSHKTVPGSIGEEDLQNDTEEDDQVAPLRAPTPPRRASRKGRYAASVEPEEGQEGVKTRRRSSRLSIAGSVTSNTSPPPSPIKRRAESTTTRGRKATRGTTGRKKKA